jgi:DNA-binding transcriptional ArsR family regulator
MCKFELTCKAEFTCEGTSTSQEPTLTHETGPLTGEEELLTMLTAVANALRLRVIAELADGRVHVSELARRLGISRPLLYMHLDRLEKAGIVTGHLELSEDGKAMKYFELAPFELRLNADVITETLRASEHRARTAPENHEQPDGQRKESDL